MSASEVTTAEERRVKNSVSVSRIVKESARKVGSMSSSASSASPRPSQRKPIRK